ncbi:conjugative transfer system coupling protein TraD (plasmid) [Vibrio sp. SS-MA-C1-2]|uniref:conjugative transfer system coupling protein TraD n=1 Tax=Vibrio sp. SS-MA-C1-2 TaxID=2908646 RepID=UPI001EEB262B|nr:conjugative transfer system coupling protein TraD [Vibrio sp. SS-MA-C1-2]UJF20202.1 conjugative transfer system coupling protein TraD [Vibrio sp. SS-MA-C1-2]
MKFNRLIESIEHSFREVYEIKQARVWFIGMVFYFIAGGLESMYVLFNGYQVSDTMMFSMMCVLVCAVMFVVRIRQAMPLLKRQAKLVSTQLTVEKLEATRKKAAKTPERTYLGTGYNYGPEHATDMYKVLSMPSFRREIKVPFFMRKIVPYNKQLNEELGGEPFLMGLGDEKTVTVRNDTWRAHSLIVGLPGTGKTTILKMMALNELWQHDKEPVLLIVIDPKNTPELRYGLEDEMRRQGRERDFYYFSPARPSESCIVDCLANINRTTDVATRIVNCIPAGGPSGEVFRAFCWERVNQVAQAIHYIGERITIQTLRYYLREGMGTLVEKCLLRYYTNHFGQTWESDLQSQFQTIPGTTLFDKMVGYYQLTLAKTQSDASVSGIIDQFSKSDSDIASKTASLNALLEQLCSEPLGNLLSPNNADIKLNDPNIVNIEELAKLGGVLYMATDGLTDDIIAGSISKLVSAAVAGASASRYNFSNGGQLPKVSFYIDEGHSAINDTLLSLLAVGRQSRYQLTLASQGLGDFPKEQLDRITSLCANTIGFRCEDQLTREYISDKIGYADLVKYTKMRSNTSNTYDGFGQFSGGRGMREDSQERPLFPPQLVSGLPNLQAICSFSNGDKTLVRLPVEPR